MVIVGVGTWATSVGAGCGLVMLMQPTKTAASTNER
jgi:hypothetical protein